MAPSKKSPLAKRKLKASRSVPPHPSDLKARCAWCLGSDEYIRYHDEEWGVPEHDDRALFELLTLEGAQAGLSWSTVLAKRPRYRQVFRNFNPRAVSRFDHSDVERLMADPGIIRNRLKIESTISNARAFLDVQAEFGTFDTYLWGFVGGKPVVNRRRAGQPPTASSPISDALSKDLKARGFRFVGTTICYALMQAAGLVNDHLLSCFRHPDHGR